MNKQSFTFKKWLKSTCRHFLENVKRSHEDVFACNDEKDNGFVSCWSTGFVGYLGFADSFHLRMRVYVRTSALVPRSSVYSVLKAHVQSSAKKRLYEKVQQCRQRG